MPNLGVLGVLGGSIQTRMEELSRCATAPCQRQLPRVPEIGTGKTRKPEVGRARQKRASCRGSRDRRAMVRINHREHGGHRDSQRSPSRGIAGSESAAAWRFGMRGPLSVNLCVLCVLCGSISKSAGATARPAKPLFQFSSFLRSHTKQEGAVAQATAPSCSDLESS